MLVFNNSRCDAIDIVKAALNVEGRTIIIFSMIVFQTHSKHVDVLRLLIYPHLIIGSRYHIGSRMGYIETYNQAQYLFSVISDFQKYPVLVPHSFAQTFIHMTLSAKLYFN
jgi:hypothetical protein